MNERNEEVEYENFKRRSSTYFNKKIWIISLDYGEVFYFYKKNKEG